METPPPSPTKPPVIEKSNHDLKTAFNLSETKVRSANFLRTVLLAAAFSLLGAVLDFYVYPEYLKEFLASRIITAILICLTLLPIFDRAQKSTLTALCHYIAILPLISLFWMIYKSGDAASPYYAGLTLVLVGVSLVLRWRFIDNVMNGLLCLSGYVILICYLPGTIEIKITHIFFVFSTAVFASTGSFFYNRLRFGEFVLRQELEENRQTLEENNLKLQVLDEAKTRFFANISHELRTPLTLILGPIEQLTSVPELQNLPAAKQTLDTLSENGLRLLRLINDLLDLVRLDTDDLPLQRRNIDLNEFLCGIRRSLGAMAQTKQIDIQIEENLPHHPILVLDPDRLEKILLNLSINALKFSEPGSPITFILREDSDQVHIEIRDQGIGISEEDLPQIFERFWQSDSSTKRKTRGTGIGLALAKSLTESMDGSIQVQSVLNQGTTFTLSFPILPLIDDSQEALPQAKPPTSISGDQFDELHEKARLHTARVEQHQVALVSPHHSLNSSQENAPQILLVDDEPGMRSYIASQLSDYHIIEAADGKQGLEAATQYRPDLIILDYMMPELDGLELAELLRGQPSTARIPIILLTAHAGDAPRIGALNVGINEFLTKPFSTVELQVRIRNILRSQEFEQDLQVKNKELNVALEQLHEHEEALVRSEKLSSLGQMSAGIVHEVNNPLNYAKTSLHILKSFQKSLPSDDAEDFVDTLKDLEDAVMRVIRIVSDLRAFTRGDETVRSPLFLEQVIQHARRLLSHDLEAVNFQVDIPEDLELLGNDNQLCQAFVNLIQNAIHATAQAEDPTIKIAAHTTPGGSLIVTIEDNGHGIPDKIRAKIFDPFFTTKDVGAGMGLGLSLTMRIIEDHGGEFSLESRPNQGTEFTIFFANPNGSDA